MRVSTADRRAQLIDAAITVLMRDGYEKASLRVIAAEAGASLAAVHVCFEDKDDLMSAAMEAFSVRLTVPVSGRAVLQRGIREAATKIMDGFWKAIVEDRNYAVAQFEVGLWSLRNTADSKIIRLIYENYEHQIAEVLDKARRLSGDEPKLPIPLLARGVVAIMDGCSFQYMAAPQSSQARELCNRLLDGLFEQAGL